MNIQSHSSEYKSMDDECSNSSIKAQKDEDSDTPIESTKNESKSNVDQVSSILINWAELIWLQRSFIATSNYLSISSLK